MIVSIPSIPFSSPYYTPHISPFLAHGEPNLKDIPGTEIAEKYCEKGGRFCSILCCLCSPTVAQLPEFIALRINCS